MASALSTDDDAGVNDKSMKQYTSTESHAIWPTKDDTVGTCYCKRTSHPPYWFGHLFARKLPDKSYHAFGLYGIITVTQDIRCWRKTNFYSFFFSIISFCHDCMGTLLNLYRVLHFSVLTHGDDDAIFSKLKMHSHHLRRLTIFGITESLESNWKKGN